MTKRNFLRLKDLPQANFGGAIHGFEDLFELAECKNLDPNDFFTDKRRISRRTKSICFACRIRNSCLDYAIENNESFGIWGGLTPKERKKLIKKLAKSDDGNSLPSIEIVVSKLPEPSKSDILQFQFLESSWSN